MRFDWPYLTAIAVMWSWEHWKRFLEHSIAFSPDALHVIVGVALQLVVGVIFRKPIASWQPWIVVLLLALLNEFADLWLARWPQADAQFGESAKDLLLTMLLPTLMMLLVRLRPQLFQRCS